MGKRDSINVQEHYVLEPEALVLLPEPVHCLAVRRGCLELDVLVLVPVELGNDRSLRFNHIRLDVVHEHRHDTHFRVAHLNHSLGMFSGPTQLGNPLAVAHSEYRVVLLRLNLLSRMNTILISARGLCLRMSNSLVRSEGVSLPLPSMYTVNVSKTPKSVAFLYCLILKSGT